ncbi:hypothetical protein [Amycolatopsis plumensis]|uniref:hypothetical protein n=1 Tax=Amycolatopsis plumensis TaxID=236508 RepID=UPI0036114FF3
MKADPRARGDGAPLRSWIHARFGAVAGAGSVRSVHAFGAAVVAGDRERGPG